MARRSQQAFLLTEVEAELRAYPEGDGVIELAYGFRWAEVMAICALDGIL